ncbi:MAG TPA: transcriptional regulator [Sedimenticola thiotaurini]|uniref:Transcriptional regulator n=1 Tax=Sedimenticola thiotaurini TaxID=1543721 RepID=A0A831RK25_9GAMM|nr:transcriptional regulator [Sedimenticola thiotaurini]
MSESPKRPIVSSAHLVSEKSSELSELEYGLIIANNAFQRWMVRCMTAAGMPDLNPIDILILHNVNHRSRPKKVADICFNLNIEDTHTATYSLRKLVKLGLIGNRKQGKENFFSTTSKGEELCLKYKKVREECLVDALGVLGIDNRELGEAAKVLRSLSGLYDQAARAAASL